MITRMEAKSKERGEIMKELKIDERLRNLLEPLQGEELDTLVEDISKRGIQNPIIVDQNGYIIDGHTRYYVAQILGIEDVPIQQIEVADEEERLERALALNLQRRRKVKIDRLRQLALELYGRGWDVDRIARSLCVRRETVKNWVNPKPPKDEPVEVKGLIRYWAVGFLVKLQSWFVSCEGANILLMRDSMVILFNRVDGSFEIEIRPIGDDNYKLEEWKVGNEGIRDVKVAEFEGTMNKVIAFALQRLTMPTSELVTAELQTG